MTEFKLTVRRTFDGERYFVSFSSPTFGTCGSIQTNEETALDSALSLLKRLLKSLPSAVHSFIDEK